MCWTKERSTARPYRVSSFGRAFSIVLLNFLSAFTPDPAVSPRKRSAQPSGLNLVAGARRRPSRRSSQAKASTTPSRCRQFPEMGDGHLCVLMVPEHVLKLFERLYEILRAISVDSREELQGVAQTLAFLAELVVLLAGGLFGKWVAEFSHLAIRFANQVRGGG